MSSETTPYSPSHVTSPHSEEETAQVRLKFDIVPKVVRGVANAAFVDDDENSDNNEDSKKHKDNNEKNKRERRRQRSGDSRRRKRSGDRRRRSGSKRKKDKSEDNKRRETKNEQRKKRRRKSGSSEGVRESLVFEKCKQDLLEFDNLLGAAANRAIESSLKSSKKDRRKKTKRKKGRRSPSLEKDERTKDEKDKYRSDTENEGIGTHDEKEEKGEKSQDIVPDTSPLWENISKSSSTSQYLSKDVEGETAISCSCEDKNLDVDCSQEKQKSNIDASKTSDVPGDECDHELYFFKDFPKNEVKMTRAQPAIKWSRRPSDNWNTQDTSPERVRSLILPPISETSGVSTQDCNKYPLYSPNRKKLHLLSEDSKIGKDDQSGVNDRPEFDDIPREGSEDKPKTSEDVFEDVRNFLNVMENTLPAIDDAKSSEDVKQEVEKELDTSRHDSTSHIIEPLPSERTDRDGESRKRGSSSPRRRRRLNSRHRSTPQWSPRRRGPRTPSPRRRPGPRTPSPRQRSRSPFLGRQVEPRLREDSRDYNKEERSYEGNCHHRRRSFSSSYKDRSRSPPYYRYHPYHDENHHASDYRAYDDSRRHYYNDEVHHGYERDDQRSNDDDYYYGSVMSDADLLASNRALPVLLTDTDAFSSPRHSSLDDRLQNELGIEVQEKQAAFAAAAAVSALALGLPDLSKPPPGYLPSGEKLVPIARVEQELPRIEPNAIEIIKEEDNFTDDTKAEVKEDETGTSLAPSEVMEQMEELRRENERERQRIRERKLAERERRLRESIQRDSTKQEECETTNGKRILEEIETLESQEQSNQLISEAEKTEEKPQAEHITSVEDGEPSGGHLKNEQASMEAPVESESEIQTTDLSKSTEKVHLISLKPLNKKERKKPTGVEAQVNATPPEDNDAIEDMEAMEEPETFVPRSPVPLPDASICKPILVQTSCLNNRGKRTIKYADGVIPGKGTPDNSEDESPEENKDSMSATPNGTDDVTKIPRVVKRKKITLHITYTRYHDESESSEDEEWVPQPPEGSPPLYHTQHFIENFAYKPELQPKS